VRYEKRNVIATTRRASTPVGGIEAKIVKTMQSPRENGFAEQWRYINHTKAVMQDFSALVALLLAVGCVHFFQKQPEIPVEAHSNWRWKVDAGLLGVVAYLLWQKTFGAHKAEYGSPAYRCVTYFGHLIFFDVQALLFLFVHLLLSTAAEGSLSTSRRLPGLYRMAYNLSPLIFCNTLVASLFVVSAKRHSGHSFWVLLPHSMAACGVALVDFFYVKHDQMILVLTPAFDRLWGSYCVYAVVYMGMLHVNYRFSKGMWPYRVLWQASTLAKVTMVAVVAAAAWLTLLVGLTLRGGKHDLAGGAIEQVAK